MTFDVENALAQVARYRRTADPLMRAQEDLAADMTAGFRREFGSELDLEVCGKALVIAAAAVVPLCQRDMPPAVIANVIGLAGEDLVRQARLGRGGR